MNYQSFFLEVGLYALIGVLLAWPAMLAGRKLLLRIKLWGFARRSKPLKPIFIEPYIPAAKSPPETSLTTYQQ